MLLTDTNSYTLFNILVSNKFQINVCSKFMRFTYKPEAKATEVQIPWEEAIMNSHNVKGTNYKFAVLPTTHSFHKEIKKKHTHIHTRAK